MFRAGYPGSCYFTCNTSMMINLPYKICLPSTLLNSDHSPKLYSETVKTLSVSQQLIIDYLPVSVNKAGVKEDQVQNANIKDPHVYLVTPRKAPSDQCVPVKYYLIDAFHSNMQALREMINTLSANTQTYGDSAYHL